jgi:purine-binding chemotaxis protein CheW
MIATSSSADRYILFSIAGTTYAVPSADVHPMEMVADITRVPNAPDFVDGVVFSRGQVLPVVNLRARFGFERVAPDLRARLLVVQLAGRMVGLIVDEAREFVTIAPGAIQPPNESLAAFSGRYLEGIASLGERMVLVVNLDRILDFSTIAVGEPPPGDAAQA